MGKKGEEIKKYKLVLAGVAQLVAGQDPGSGIARGNQ